MSDKRLIMIICNNGYAEEIMDVAKQAGAQRRYNYAWPQFSYS